MPEQAVFVTLASKVWLNSRDIAPTLPAIIAVDDTLKGLGDLAAACRKRYKIPVVGVTGSNGKTTTKEMLAAILSQLSPGIKTEGNLNNLIGLPLMMFRMTGEDNWGVFEMGMSEFGEIDRLAEIASPDVGIVLNAFPAHLESMGSVENVAKAKGELLLRLPECGCAVVNADDPLVSQLPCSEGTKRISFGFSECATVQAKNIVILGTQGVVFDLIYEGEQRQVKLSAFGRHNVGNALAAAAAAFALGLPIEIITAGLESFTPYQKRLNLNEIAGINLIDDSYNANPASVGAALSALADLKGDRKTFVALGDMLELGGNEVEMHRIAGVQAAQVADRLYLYGKLMQVAAEGAVSAGMSDATVLKCATHHDIAADICMNATAGDFVLLKGSRGMKMEKVADEIKKIMNKDEV